MGNGLFELQIKFSGDITRIFYYFYVGQKIILTNGYVKKSRKTPRGELEQARKFKVDYKRRHNHE
ncbi:MAG: type II toxin-antitoxin system RelE/ParE family toxin [Eubacterium sp.]|nr:type II toxin-antitoxin system RelE/ParE family toxin [Eubacterium sp.]